MGRESPIAKTNISHRSQAIVSSPLVDRGSSHVDHIHRAIRYGSKIVLEHPLTSRNLHSHDLKYYHSQSSKQQSVSCAQELDENDCWIVIPTKANRQVKAGDIVFIGDSFRLVHVPTRALLHTHRGHPPVCATSASWQEVTAFGLCDDTIDTTDSNDIWKLVTWNPLIKASEAASRPMTVEAWKPGASVALYHVCTGAWLSSHFQEFHIVQSNSDEDPRTQQQVYADSFSQTPNGLLTSAQEWCVISVEPADLLEIPMSLLGYSVTEWESAHRSITLRFGHQIVLTDNRTHATLHSHSLVYTRSGSSGAQQVTGSSGYIDGNDFWIIMPPALAYAATKPGDPVLYGMHILLKHAQTGAYLYTDSSHFSSRLDGRSLEVSCRPYPFSPMPSGSGSDSESGSGSGSGNGSGQDDHGRSAALITPPALSTNESSVEERGFHWRVDPDVQHRASASWRRGEHFSFFNEAFSVLLRTDHMQFDVSSIDRQQIVFGQPTVRPPMTPPPMASPPVFSSHAHGTQNDNESIVIEQLERRRAIQRSLQAQLDRIEREEREMSQEQSQSQRQHQPEDESESDSSDESETNAAGREVYHSSHEEEEDEEDNDDDDDDNDDDDEDDDEDEYDHGPPDEHPEVYEEFFHIFHHHDSEQEAEEDHDDDDDDNDDDDNDDDDFIHETHSPTLFSSNRHRSTRRGDWRVTYARPATQNFLPADFAARVSSSLYESAPLCYSTEIVRNKHVE